VIWADSSPYVLWVLLLGGSREPDEVAEQNGYDLPLLERGRRCGFREGRGALVAELRPGGILRAAERADHAFRV